MKPKQIVILLGLLMTTLFIIPPSVDAQEIDITTNLVNGETYDGIFVIVISAEHPTRSIMYIGLYIDGTFIDSRWDQADWSYNWDTRLYVDGAHSIHIHVSAGGAEDDTYADYDVYVDNTPESTTTTTTTTIPDSTGPGIQIKFAAIGALATVTFGVLGFVFKSDLIEKRKHKAMVILVGVLVFAVMAGSVWVFL
ncbi:MAG: hypothetical protein KAU48_02215 [Candidatus Thorarchaeota archaeon]|nr:hypothetical protein [Candidatus Thorarchaeota archaeon]